MNVKVSSAHSCYLVNNPSYKEVYTDEGYKAYYRDDLIPVKPHHPIMLTVTRDKDPLRMEFVKDSLRTLVELRSKISWVYWLNFAAVYPFPGIGFIGDIGTSKKWEYNNDVFVDILHPRYSLTRHTSLQAPEEKYEYERKYDFEAANVTYTKGTSAANSDHSSVTFDKDAVDVNYAKGSPAADLDRPSVIFAKDSLRRGRKKKMTRPE